MIERNIFCKRYFEEEAYGKQDVLIIYRNYKLLLDNAKNTIPLLNKARLILDFGCAFGVGTTFLARQFPEAKVVGVDISNYAIKKAKSKYKLESVEYYCLDLSRTNHLSFLQKEYGGFDLILSRDTLEHIQLDKQEKILNTFAELLESDGVIAVQTPNKLNLSSHSDKTHIGLRPPNSWKSLFAIFFEQVVVLVRQYVPLLWQLRQNKELWEFQLPIFGYNIYILAKGDKQ